MFAVCLAALALVALPTWAGEQIVAIDAQAEFGSMGSEREQAMLLAVIRESQAILPDRLDQTRKELLAEFMQARHEKYILSYSQLAGTNPQERMWQVQVNTKALTSLLKDLGVYYTIKDSLAYRLKLLSEDDRGRGRITELETLSGCTRDNVQFPELRVQSTSEGSWNGRLKSQDQTWTASQKNLDDLWVTLWSNFFSHPENILPFVQSLDIRIHGWSTISAISGFSKRIQSWTQMVDRVSLLQITGDSQGLHGRWQILTPKRDTLEERLDRYTQSRGLDWKLQEGESEAD
ncbi:MAG: hypothetical protein U5L00_06980 [Desulfovermiculus sp.]|nr:hypothetical protein [Desulfovermiculus sp.]